MVWTGVGQDRLSLGRRYRCENSDCSRYWAIVGGFFPITRLTGRGLGVRKRVRLEVVFWLGAGGVDAAWLVADVPALPLFGSFSF